MLKPLDPKLDAVFQILFADPRCRRALIALLTAVLRPSEPIAEVEVLNPELPKNLVDDKGMLLGIRVRLEGGRQVDVEMQSQSQPTLRQRLLLYSANLYSSQIGGGSTYLCTFRGRNARAFTGSGSGLGLEAEPEASSQMWTLLVTRPI